MKKTKLTIIFLLTMYFTGCNTIIERDITIDSYYTLEIIDEPTMHGLYDNFVEQFKAGKINALLFLTMSDYQTKQCFSMYNYVDANTYEYNQTNDSFIKLKFYTDKSLINENRPNSGCLTTPNRSLLEIVNNSSKHYAFDANLYALIEKEKTVDGRFVYEAYLSIEFLKHLRMISSPQEDWTLSINYWPISGYTFGGTFYEYRSNDVTISASDIEAVLALIPENNSSENNESNNTEG